MPADLDRFKQTLVYRRKAPIDTLLEDLATLRTFDREHEKVATRAGLIALVTFASGIGALFATWPRNGSSGSLMFAICVPLAVSFVVALVIRFRHARFNLEDRRYQLAACALQFLRRDSRPDAEVDLELDFRKPDHKTKFLREGKVGPWKVKYYTDRWLRLQGRLLDGTSYRLSTIEKHQHRSKWATSRSGKSKHKTKTKSATEMIVGLKVKTKRVPGIAEVQNARAAVQLPEFAALKAFRVHAPAGAEVSVLTLRSITAQPWTCAPAGKPEGPNSGVRWFAMTFLSLYQVLNSARAPEQA